MTEKAYPVPVAAIEFSLRDLHLIKKALAVAVLAIDRHPDSPFQSTSDQTDMKALLDNLIRSDTEMEHYARAARIVINGKPDGFD